MRDLYYVNSRNQKLDFTQFPYLIKDMEELADFDSDYEIQNSRISFSKGPAEISLVLNISANTQEDFGDAVNYFFEVTQFDVLNNSFGRLYYGSQYVECNITGSTKKDWCMGVPYMMNYIRLVTTKPYWVIEHSYHFESSDIISTNNKRYAYKYKYRYANGLANLSITNEHFSECNFRIIIQGPVVKPVINVGGYRYYVDAVLEENERLEIDSASETIYKIMSTGIKVNMFNNRDKKNSVFRPIQPGYQEISWSGKFDFDIVLYEERSEPKW